MARMYFGEVSNQRDAGSLSRGTRLGAVAGSSILNGKRSAIYADLRMGLLHNKAIM